MIQARISSCRIDLCIIYPRAWADRFVDWVTSILETWGFGTGHHEVRLDGYFRRDQCVCVLNVGIHWAVQSSYVCICTSLVTSE